MKISTLILLILSILASFFSFYNDWYYLGYLLLFFFSPAIILYLYVWKHLCTLKRISLIATALGMSMLAVVMEMIGVQYNFWVFFEDVDSLCPLRIGNIPLEEILFYYGATLQVCMLYAALEVRFIGLGLREGLDKTHQNKLRIMSESKFGKLLIAALCLVPVLYVAYKLWGNSRDTGAVGAYVKRSFSEGRWVPAWALMVLPYFLVGVYILKKNIRTVHLVAFAFTIMISLPLYFLFEHNAIVRGHWVYNQQRILGPVIGVTPIEELFLYLTAIFISVALYEGCFEILKRFKEKCPDSSKSV